MKKRLDVILCEMDPELSRSKAQALIMSGDVYVDNQKELKSGAMISEGTDVEIRAQKPKYVSRGGLKLEKALRIFPVSLTGKVCMDIGSSTGGFTDCMLLNGAARVYAVDSGTNQLDYRLRTDPRVVVMEKTNIRFVIPEMFPEKIEFASVDVSFISLSLVLPAALPLLDQNKEMVMLIKPQFEAGREKVGKKGVVKDPKVHCEVIEKIVNLAEENALTVQGLGYSPIKGPEGNIEYLIHTARMQENKAFDRNIIKQTVCSAHEELGG